MRNCKSAILAAVFVFGILCACKSKGEDKIFTIQVGDYWNETHPMAAAMDTVFKAQIEEKTKRKITVIVRHNGQLGSEKELWDSVRNGTLEVAVVGAPMNNEWPVKRISDWPFLYRDIDHAKKVWTSSIPNELNIQFHETFPSVYMLAWGPNSSRTFTSSKKLTTIKDMAGLTFRVPDNPVHLGIVESLGASAQVISLGNLYSALMSGDVDGQDNGMVTVVSQRFYEVQKYLYETNHIISTLEIIINASFMDSLPVDYKTIVEDAAKAAALKAWNDYILSFDDDREFLVSKGMIISPCTPEEQALIVQRARPMVEKLLTDNVTWAPKLIDRIRAVQ
ncbi:MAG: TRAP transporter substrate-binding protein [Termitinemataceae bacterium]|nr:MAG: TRAP transporter substrate-binding protein [Termitinemataceae bacterium]